MLYYHYENIKISFQKAIPLANVDLHRLKRFLQRSHKTYTFYCKKK